MVKGPPTLGHAKAACQRARLQAELLLPGAVPWVLLRRRQLLLLLLLLLHLVHVLQVFHRFLHQLQLRCLQRAAGTCWALPPACTVRACQSGGPCRHQLRPRPQLRQLRLKAGLMGRGGRHLPAACALLLALVLLLLLLLLPAATLVLDKVRARLAGEPLLDLQCICFRICLLLPLVLVLVLLVLVVVGKLQH
jgi:hypothetical protein